MQEVKPTVLRIMRENRQTKLKMILSCNCEMVRNNRNGGVQYLEAFFHTETIQNLDATDESEEYEQFIETIQERIQNFNNNASNWRFQRVISLDIHFVEYNPLSGSSYMKLPKVIAEKKAVMIIMKNQDNKCFKWCITRAFNPIEKDPQRITKIL